MIRQMNSGKDTFYLTSEYWDCDCGDKLRYIHPTAEKKCTVCGVEQEGAPDSHVNEVLMAGLLIADMKGWPKEAACEDRLPVLAFNKPYRKMRGSWKARLLDVYHSRFAEISPAFRHYDADDDHFHGLSGPCLVLILLGNNGDVFTTIRKDNQENCGRYCSTIGLEFRLIYPGQPNPLD